MTREEWLELYAKHPGRPKIVDLLLTASADKARREREARFRGAKAIHELAKFTFAKRERGKTSGQLEDVDMAPIAIARLRAHCAWRMAGYSSDIVS